MSSGFVPLIQSLELTTVSVLGVLSLALLTMGCNWGLEVVKWKKLLNAYMPVTWKTAIRAVLTGVSFGLFGPNRFGEIVGRVLALPSHKRIDGAVISSINGLAQTAATFTFGVVGLILLVEVYGHQAFGLMASKVMQITFGLLVVLMLVLYYRTPFWGKWVANLKWLGKYRNQLMHLSTVESSLLSYLYHVSLLRFCTFIVQYLIVFHFLTGSEAWFDMIAATVLTLFSSTVVPFLPIPDLLIKESMALGYFELMGFSSEVIATGVFVVWAINIALPAILGSVVLHSYRLFSKA
mgnify:CR=1 FL=1